MSEEKSFSDLLANALRLSQEDKFSRSEKILITDRVENFFETRLNCLLLDKQKIEDDLFLCASYIAKTLAGFIYEFPVATRAAEYLYSYLVYRKDSQSSDNFIRPEDFLIRGGQTCFVICVFFPSLHLRRGVNEDYYMEMGTTFFYEYFQIVGRKFAYSMAEHFKELVPLTREAVEG